MILSPTKPAPIRPDRPTPRMVERQSGGNLVDRKAQRQQREHGGQSAPAAMPHSAPMKVEPVR